MKQVELNCIKTIKNELLNNNGINNHNCNYEYIKKLINNARPNSKQNEFPDFYSGDSLIEHFTVTSSKDNKKGSDYSNYKNEFNKETNKYFQQEDLKEEAPQTITTNSFKGIYEDSSYENFNYSLKKHFDSHIYSLTSRQLENNLVVFIVEQDDARLCIYENNKFVRFYLLGEDKKMLLYLKQQYPNVNYLIFKQADVIELINLNKIDELIIKAKDNLDIRGGRMNVVNCETIIDM